MATLHCGVGSPTTGVFFELRPSMVLCGKRLLKSYSFKFVLVTQVLRIINSFTFFIYIRTGRTIYETYKHLHQIHSSELNQLNISTVKTTEITVTTKTAGDNVIQIDSLGHRRCSPGPNARSLNGSYSVHVSGGSCNTAEVNEEPVLFVQGTTLQQTFTRQVAHRGPGNVPRRRNQDLNHAALAYTKCSVLFFTAMLITWIPSSANRLYSLVHEKEKCIPLEFMAAFVLPLQGFWNAVIYTVISWSACLEFFDGLKIQKLSTKSKLIRRNSGMNPIKTSSDRPSAVQ